MAVENEMTKENKMMSEAATVSSAPGNLHNGIRMEAMSEKGSLLEELSSAYQELGPKERQQVRTFLLTLARATAIDGERRHNDDTRNHHQ